MSIFSKKFPFYRQLDQMDCGATCLKIISKFYGKDISLQYLRKQCGITREGVSILGLSDAAESIGLKTLPLSLGFEQLSTIAPLPCIVHWRQRHFIVVYAITKDKVYVSDPAIGRITYTHEKFLAGWLYNNRYKENSQEGFCLFVEPTNIFHSFDDKDQETHYDLRFLVPYLSLHKQVILNILLGVLGGILIQICLPFLTKYLVDIGINNKSLQVVYLILAGQLCLFISQTFITLLRRFLVLELGYKINISIISEFLIKLIRLPIAFFESKMHQDLLQRIEDQIHIERFLSNTSVNAAFSILNILVFGTIVLIFDYKLFFIFSIGSTLYFLWVLLFVKRRAILEYIRRDESIENRSSILQIIRGIEEIKLNNSERRRRIEWESIQNRLYETSRKDLRYEQLQIVGGNFIIQLTNIIITIVAAIAVINGELSLGEMLAILYFIGQLIEPINNFIEFITTSQSAKISIERIGEILDFQEETHNGQIQNNEIKEDIHVKNVSFKYGGPSSRQILKNLSFSIPNGKITAIVGSSGSGKTTLMKLLLKFYDPTKGQIIVGNDDLSNFNSESWRKKCGVVMQDGFIFADTMLRNITESEQSESIDKERLEKAVNISCLDTVVKKLPLDFYTNLGAGGISLSGGENQRLRIARSIYKDPDILFYDEATSALDANTEKRIMTNLMNYFKSKTVLIIAHRLSTVKNADNILVLDNGEIVEQGTHEALVALKGNYYKLVKNQLDLGN